MENHKMELSQAISKFNTFRGEPLDAQDLEKIAAIVEELGLQDFTVVESGAYIRDRDSIIHINPGFVASKKPAIGCIEDSVYEDVGFFYRCWLSGTARHKGGETKLNKLHCPLCAGLPGDDHQLEECPRHP
jgi:hypothetical protein